MYILYMYYTEEVTLLYQGVMVNVIKHGHLLRLVLTILNNSDDSYIHFLSFQIIYLQLYFNLLGTLIASYYYYLLLILKLYPLVFLEFN